MNHLSRESLGGLTPIEAMFNRKLDISPYLYAHWWMPVYYDSHDRKQFPSTSKERTGRVVGVTWDKGDLMTFAVLDDLTRKVNIRSNIRPMTDDNPNYKAITDLGEEMGTTAKPVVQSFTEAYQDNVGNNSDIELYPISPDELIGRTFLKTKEEDGSVLRARIVRKIEERDAANKARALKFLVEIGDSEYDEIMTYNELCDIIEERNEAELNGEAEMHAYRGIVGHQGPLKPGEPRYNGSAWNLLVHWEDGSQTWEPLKIMAADDPVSVAAYGKSADLLDQPGWKRLKKIAQREKKFNRMVKQSKVAPSRKVPLFKFGIELPRSIKEVWIIDNKYGNTRWKLACDTEIELLNSYSTFKDLGKGAQTPTGYKHIRLHWVFDVKEDRRH